MKRLLLLFTTSILLTNLFMVPALYAIPPEQRSLFNNGLYFYDPYSGTLDQCGDNYSGSVSSGTMESFIEEFGQSAFDIGREYAIPYEIILAQAAHESAWGQSSLTQEAYNFFGIKADVSWDGPVWTGQTREVINGQDVYVDADFRLYASPYDGFRGYAEFIHDNQRYSEALNYPGDPIRYIEEVARAGYATDPSYTQLTVAVYTQIAAYISENNLFPPSSSVDHSASAPTSRSSNACLPSASSGDFIHYLQGDPAWGGMELLRVGGSSNVSDGGCAQTSVAMVLANMYDPSITPADVTRWHNDRPSLYGPAGRGSSWAFIEAAPAGMSNGALEVTNYGNNLSNALNAIERGGLVIATGIVRSGNPLPYTTGGHIIVIREILPNGNYLIANTINCSSGFCVDPLEEEYTFEQLNKGRNFWGVN